MILDEVIKVTNRRVNALEHIPIPRAENTIKYINGEFDEFDREDFIVKKRCRARRTGMRPLQKSRRKRRLLTYKSEERKSGRRVMLHQRISSVHKTKTSCFSTTTINAQSEN